MMHGRKFYSHVCPLCSAVTIAEFGKPWRCSGRRCNARSTGVEDPEVKAVALELTAAELDRIERLAEVMGGTLGDAIGAAVQSSRMLISVARAGERYAVASVSRSLPLFPVRVVYLAQRAKRNTLASRFPCVPPLSGVILCP